MQSRKNILNILDRDEYNKKIIEQINEDSVNIEKKNISKKFMKFISFYTKSYKNLIYYILLFILIFLSLKNIKPDFLLSNELEDVDNKKINYTKTSFLSILLSILVIVSYNFYKIL